MDLNLEYTVDEIMDEYFYFLDTPGKCNEYSNHNKIIKLFQQDIFFKNEKLLWMDETVRNRLFINRMKYLHKNTFTPDELLTGFKKSGIYYGYSHFNPLLAKWFYEYCGTKISYDPCGGWGHRLLGSLNLDLYIYNDISKTVCENIGNIINFFDITNAIVYNNDASVFIPNEKFDTIFTCPPYRSLEKYENITDITLMNTLLQHIYNVFITTDTCKYLGLVIREDMNILDKYDEKIELISNNMHFIKRKKYKEYLYIYKKQ